MTTRHRDTTTWSDTDHVATLADAIDVLGRLDPGPDAPADVRRAYHLRAARVYDRVAEANARHRWESTAYAQVERNRAARCQRPVPIRNYDRKGHHDGDGPPP